MGQMMNQPLLISSIIEFAARHYGGSEIVSRRVEGDLHRYTYRDCQPARAPLANALHGLGVSMGDRVATLAWNGYRHLEAVLRACPARAPCCTRSIRACIPTRSPTSSTMPKTRYLFFDLTFLPLIEAMAAHCTSVKAFVLMCDRERMPRKPASPTCCATKT